MTASDNYVSVPRAALEALIEYANSQRQMVDSEFNGSAEEDDASEHEFQALVDALHLEPPR